MSNYDINNAKNDIQNLQEQNSYDFQEIKRLDGIIKDYDKKILQAINMNNQINKKIQYDYENIKKFIIDENIVFTINEKIDENTNKIIDVSQQFTNKITFIRNCYEKAIIAEQLKNDFAWKDFDKIYITFTFDDSNPDISDIETLFETKNVPCCYATVPTRLDNTTNSGEKVRDVLVRAVTNGGEVLSHWYSPLTSESTEQDYYDVYIGAKKTLTQAGFDVNGIIVNDGTNYDTQDWIKGVRYARPYYRYSDLVGKSQNITQYNHQRKFLSNNDTVNKGFIDKAISEGNQWISFASHGANDNVTIDLLSSLLDYIATKPNVEIVNFKYLYDTFGTTKLEKRLMDLENK